MSDGHYQLIFRLLVIAAIAVVVVSLVGVGTITGIIPRFDPDSTTSEHMRSKRTDTASERQGTETIADPGARSGAANEYKPH